jgi:hypothetical protein
MDEDGEFELESEEDVEVNPTDLTDSDEDYDQSISNASDDEDKDEDENDDNGEISFEEGIHVIHESNKDSPPAVTEMATTNSVDLDVVGSSLQPNVKMASSQKMQTIPEPPRSTNKIDMKESMKMGEESFKEYMNQFKFNPYAGET